MKPPSDHPSRVLGATLLILLAALGPVLAFSAGSYFPRSWLPILLFVAALTAVTLLLGPIPRIPRTSTILISVFALQLSWTALSLLWASSPVNAWEEINRSALFGLALLITLLAVTYLGRRGAFWLAVAVLAGVSLVAAIAIFRLATLDDPIILFTGGRFHYPVTYWNALSALLMIGFWPALTLASARNLPPWVAPVLVAGAAVLAQLALLPESRGGLWTFLLVAPWFVILSPHRFRALFHLATVLAAIIVSWGTLTDLYLAALQNERLDTAIDHVLTVLTLSAGGVAVAVAAGQLFEKLTSPLGRRAVRAVGAILVLLALVGALAGLSAADRAVDGGLRGLAQRTWDQLTSDEGPQRTTESGHRFSDVGLSGRLQQWRIAWHAFEEHPLLGLGAQNFEPYFYEHRTSDLQVKQPHSQPMQLLAELGLPGAALWLVFVAGAFAVGVSARFRARRSRNQAAVAALLLGTLSWFIHSSADWLWQLTGVTWPAILLLGGLISLTSRTAGEPAAADSVTEGEPPTEHDRAVPARFTPALRVAGLLVAALVFVSAFLPYLSLRLDELAYGSGNADTSASLAAADRAARLDPTSPAPLVARAHILAAEAAAAAGDSASPSVREDLLRLRLLALEKARSRDPVSWSLALQTGEAALEYREAVRETNNGSAERQLLERARGHLRDAQRLNPRQPEIQERLAELG